MKTSRFFPWLLHLCAIGACLGFSNIQPPTASAQENWTAGDDSVNARKMARYQQLVDATPEKSYAFTQMMALAGKTGYETLIGDYTKKIENSPNNPTLHMILGHIYAHGKRFHEAIAAYRRAIQIKETPLAWISIADAESQSKNFDAAAQAYEKALTLRPGRTQSQEIWRAMAEIALYRRDVKRAQECFQKLIDFEPNSLFIRRELAQIYAQNKLYKQARETLAQALSLPAISSNDKDQLARDIAILYEQEGDDGNAQKAFENLQNKLPAGHWMQREITQRLIDIHRRNGTLKSFTNALQTQWKSPTYEQHLELANLYDESADSAKALQHIQAAIKISPKLPEAHLSLIQYYRSHGQSDKMTEARQALVNAIPNNAGYRFDLYEAYAEQKNIPKAIAVLDACTKQFPNDFDTQMHAAQAYQMHGFATKALAIYESWIKKHPNDPQALEALGDYYDSHGQKEKARQTWQKIESAPIDKAAKLEMMARIFDEHGYAEQSEALYEKSLAANPNDCQSIAQFADILTRNAKTSQAVQAWENFIENCHDNAAQTQAAKHIADIYSARGAKMQAIKKYRGKCEENPDNPQNYLLFADIALQLGMPNEAIPTIQSWLDAHPKKNPQILKTLSALLIAAGNFTQAGITLDTLAQFSESQKRDALIAMSDIDLAQGKLDDAQKHLAQALALNANDAQTQEKLGDILFKLRLYDEAATHYENAFQIDSLNHAAAFKMATCLAIVGKDDKANDIYVNIVTDAQDETLILHAAQRVMDNLDWRGKLNELNAKFFPLLRAPRHKPLYLDILLMLADMQTQPHVLALKSYEYPQTFQTRHALKQLATDYAPVLTEALLSSDPSQRERALSLSEWLASPQSLSALERLIDNAPSNTVGRDTQLRAMRAIAHMQSPAALPVLQKYLSPTYPRAMREHAIWAIGLIHTDDAANTLHDLLPSEIDSFRALAIIGLGRQNLFPQDTANCLNHDPSMRVKTTAAWALALNHMTSESAAILKIIENSTPKPYNLWIIAQLDTNQAARTILTALWDDDAETRQMARQIIYAPRADTDFSQLTQAEARGIFIQGETSYYMSNVNLDALIESMVQMALGTPNQDAADAWMSKNADNVIHTIASLAESSANDKKIRMLQTLTSPDNALFHATPNADKLTQRALQNIAPQLRAWISLNNDTLAGLSLQALAIAQTSDAVQLAIQTVASQNAAIPLKLDAIRALAIQNSPQSHDALRKLANAPHYLIRANAIQYLDPNNPQDRAAIENATHDNFRIVAQTARERLL